MKRTTLLILCLLCVTALAATATVTAKKWTIAWRVRTGGAITAAPIQFYYGNKGVVFGICVASHDGFVYGLDRHSGKRLWNSKLGSPVESLARQKGGILATTADGRLICLETKTGKILWQYKTGDTLAAPPTVEHPIVDILGKVGFPGRIYLTSLGAKVYCFDLKGKLLWTAKTSDAINAQAVPISGIGVGHGLGAIAVGCCDGKVYVFARKDGKQLAAIDLKDYIPTSPVAGKDCFYVVTAGGEASKIDNKTFKILWTAKPNKKAAATAGSVFVTPRLLGQRLIVADDRGNLHALDATNGKPLWSIKVRGGITTGPILAENENELVVATDSGRVYAINPVNGKTLWSYRVGGEITNVVVQTGPRPRLLVTNNTGWIYCIKPKAAKAPAPKPAAKEKP